jgi:hypothetical protein
VKTKEVLKMNTRGGAREGAGRPKLDRKYRHFRLTDAENGKVKEYIKSLREEMKMKTYTSTLEFQSLIQVS